jgi:hypothetical protein
MQTGTNGKSGKASPDAKSPGKIHDIVIEGIAAALKKLGYDTGVRGDESPRPVSQLRSEHSGYACEAGVCRGLLDAWLIIIINSSGMRPLMT